MAKNLKNLKLKILASIILALMLLNSILPTAYGFISDITDNASFGVISGSLNTYGHELHYTVYGGQTVIAFCTQKGVKSPNGRTYGYGTEFNVNRNDPAYNNISDMIYFGYTVKHGYGLPGNRQAQMDACATQEYVWETRGYGNNRSTWKNGYMSESYYQNWLNETNNRKAQYERAVSFNGNTINVPIGGSTSVHDNNGVMANYQTFNIGNNGVTYSHSQGSNDLYVSANSNSNNSSFWSSDYGIYELLPNGNQYNQSENSTFLCIEFGSSNTQNLIISNHVDPSRFILNVNVLQGTAAIHKTNVYGNPVSGSNFGLYTDSSATNEIRSGSTDSNGNVSFYRLAPGTYYTKEKQAANGYLLDSTVKSINVANGQTTTINVTNGEPTGKITVKKINNIGNNLQGATFQIIANHNITNKAGTKIFYTEGQIAKTITTNSNGLAEASGLPLGEYRIKEIKAPNGYLLNTKVITTNLKYKDQNTAVITYTTDNIIDTEPTGTITFDKIDKETNKVAQGDSTLQGAVYTLYAAEDIYNVARTKKFYTKDQIITTRTTDKNGNCTSITDLPMGKYYVKETKAPEGYLLDTSRHDITLSYKDQNTAVITEKRTYSDQVKKRDVSLFKSGINKLSGKTPGLQSAEFTIKLNKDVQKAYSMGYSYAEVWGGIDENGNKVNVDQLRVQSALKIAPNYAKSSTDKEGYIYVDNLPYGKYYVKETATPKDFETAVDFTFTISQDKSEIAKDSQKTLRLVVNDEQLESYVTLVKKDKTTGKTISLNSAVFKIKAASDIIDRATGKVLYAKGSYITQKVGRTTYDTFTTNSKNLVVSNKKNEFTSIFDDLGTVTTPLKLPVGKYEIEEIQAPTGFLDLEGKLEFSIENLRDYDKDQDGDFTKEVDILNEQPTGTIIIDKTITNPDTTVNKSLIDRTDLSGIQFTLFAKDKIKDMADDSLIYDKNQIVGVYNLNKDGTLEINKLPMGEYFLKETKTLNGLVTNDEIYNITFTKNDNVTKVYTNKLDVENNAILVAISKVELTSSDEVLGAKLQVIDSTGNVIDEWVSDGTSHIIEGLNHNEKYTIKEIETPEGYYINENDFEFTLNDTKDIQNIKVTNELVLKNIILTKKDKDLKFTITKDFTFGLFSDKDCTKLIKEYNGDKGIIEFTNLKVGTYYIKETKAPEYYNLSDKVLKIDIKANKTQGIYIDDVLQEESNYTSKIDFENKIQEGKIKILKVDKDDEKITLKGIKFALYNTDTNKLVENLVTGEDGTIESKLLRCDTNYLIFETETIEGYVLNDTPIKFRVKNNETKEIKVTNEKIKSKIEINKIANDNNDITKDKEGKGLKDTYFNIYDANHKVLYENLKTDENGKIDIILTYGKYYVQEVRPPEFYLLASNFENNETVIDVKKNGEYIPITFKNGSVKLGLIIEKEGLVQTQANDEIVYNFPQLKNTSNVPLDDFIWRDVLPADYIKATRLYTGTYNEDLRYEVWYKTNKQDYRRYDNPNSEDGKYSTLTNNYVNLSKLNSDDEYVTEYELRFGTVKAGFEAEEKPILFAKVDSDIKNDDKWTNRTYLYGNYTSIDGKTISLASSSDWQTTSYKFELNTKDYPYEVLPRTGF